MPASALDHFSVPLRHTPHILTVPLLLLAAGENVTVFSDYFIGNSAREKGWQLCAKNNVCD